MPPSTSSWDRDLFVLWEREDVFAKHVKFLFIREREHFNSRGVELVVGDVEQPGAEETSPANSQHNMDVVRGQIMVIAIDILDSLYFSDI